LHQLQRRITDLVARGPRGYGTCDADGQPVIQSELPGLEWFGAANHLLHSPDHEAEKRALRQQLDRSVGNDNCGGRLYELVAALAHGPVESDKVKGGGGLGVIA
jgi:hypothetical protein